MDIKVHVQDDLGNNITGATVSAHAYSSSGDWTGALTDIGGGDYLVCNVGSFDGSGGGGITIDAAASKTNYQPDTGSGSATNGDLSGCP